MDNIQKLAVIGVLVLVVWFIFKTDLFKAPHFGLQPTAASNNSNSQVTSPDKINNSTPANTSVGPPKPQIIEYAGTARDEVGNTARINLRLKPDLTEASMGENGGNGPFLSVRELAGGIYQFTEGTVLGVQFVPSYQSCTVYNSDGSYFCTLYRVSTSTDILQNTASAPTQQTIADSSKMANDSSVKATSPTLNYDTWIGRQPAYNAKGESGQDIIVNGSPVTTPACECKHTTWGMFESTIRAPIFVSEARGK
jgi:hypothetical protein